MSVRITNLDGIGSSTTLHLHARNSSSGPRSATQPLRSSFSPHLRPATSDKREDRKEGVERSVLCVVRARASSQKNDGSDRTAKAQSSRAEQRKRAETQATPPAQVSDDSREAHRSKEAHAAHDSPSSSTVRDERAEDTAEAKLGSFTLCPLAKRYEEESARCGCVRTRRSARE